MPSESEFRDVEMEDVVELENEIEETEETEETPLPEKQTSAPRDTPESAKSNGTEHLQTASSDVRDKSASAHETPAQLVPAKNLAQPASDTKRKSPLSSTEQIKLDKEKNRIREVIQNVSPAALQQVVRENWRLFLFDGYDEVHISFIIRAGLKNANQAVLDRVLRDDVVFKESFQAVAARKPSIINRVLADVTPPQLLENLSESTFKEVMEYAIDKAPAKDLINWLSKGKRLGFHPDDVLDGSDESVVPDLPLRPISNQPPINYQTSPYYPPPPQQAQHQQFQPTQRSSIYKPPQGPLSIPSNFQPPGRSAPSLYSTTPQQYPPPARDPLLLEQEKNKAAQDAALRLATRDAALKRTLDSRHFEAAPANSPLMPQELTCHLCNKAMPNISGYKYHMSKKVCQDGKATDERWGCKNCGSYFLGKQGLNYHEMRDVCKKAHGNDAPSKNATSKHAPATSHLPKPPMHSPAPPMKTNGTVAPPQHVSTTAAQRPPMHTPKDKKTELEYRMSPADLPPAKRAAMDAEIVEEDRRFQKKMDEIPADITLAERLRRETGYKNANATRKSQIRRSYNVSLRLRDGQKAARDAASTPSNSGLLEQFRAPSSSAAKANPNGPSANGFSPNNTSGTNTPVSGLSHISIPNGNGVTNNTHPKRPADQVFGLSPHVPLNYPQLHLYNKRQRTSEDDGTSSPGTGYNSPFQPQPSSGLAMIQVEDAAASYAKQASMKKKTTPARQSNTPAPAKMTPSKNISVVLPSTNFAGKDVYTIVDSSSEDDNEDDEDIPATAGGVKSFEVESNGAADVHEEEDETMDSLVPSIEASH